MPRKGIMSVSVTAKKYEQLKKRADAEGVSVGKLIEVALDKAEREAHPQQGGK